MPALGRHVKLGDLYNAKNEEIISSASLWRQNIIKANSIHDLQPYSYTNFFAENSEQDRMSAFDISAELELSFLGGLVSVGGSANYVKDSKSTEKIMASIDARVPIKTSCQITTWKVSLR